MEPINNTPTEQTNNFSVKNLSIKNSPKTTISGHLIMLIASLMLVFKYLLPMVYTLKEQAPYELWHIGVVAAVGLFLLYMNDTYFSQIFSTTRQIAAKKFGVDKEEK